LAPEYRYPSPVEDVVRAYEHLVHTLNVDSEKIIVVGDSAGAALSLEMLFITHDPSMFEIEIDDQNNNNNNEPVLNELPRPAGTILISPLVTDETTSESWNINQKYDYITHYTAKVIKRDYFEPVKTGGDDDDEKANEILGILKLNTGFAQFLSPHVLMYIGNLEVLRDDALHLAMKAEQDGVAWQTVIEDNVHDWFCVREVVKDKATITRADQTFADFCYRAIGKQHSNTGEQQQQSYIPTPRDSVVSSGFLAVVKEEDEDDDDTEESFYQSNSTPSNSSVSDFRFSKLSLDEFEVSTQKQNSSKRSSDIVFV
jgi:hypothetical protein